MLSTQAQPSHTGPPLAPLTRSAGHTGPAMPHRPPPLPGPTDQVCWLPRPSLATQAPKIGSVPICKLLPSSQLHLPIQAFLLSIVPSMTMLQHNSPPPAFCSHSNFLLLESSPTQTGGDHIVLTRRYFEEVIGSEIGPDRRLGFLRGIALQ